jgi:hypothetical protein
MAIRPTKAAPLPHSWRIADWPANVYPNRPGPAKYVIRVNLEELISLGALVRVGRDMVVIGEGFARFLARKIDRVEGYVPPGLSTAQTKRAAENKLSLLSHREPDDDVTSRPASPKRRKARAAAAASSVRP